MDLHMQGTSMSMTEDDSSSSGHSSSLELTPIPEDLPGHPTELDDVGHTTSASIDAPNQENSIADTVEKSTVIHSRAYQIEMFQKSLEQNIIVAVGQIC
jgi:hypothetical protein